MSDTPTPTFQSISAAMAAAIVRDFPRNSDSQNEYNIVEALKAARAFAAPSASPASARTVTRYQVGFDLSGVLILLPPADDRGTRMRPLRPDEEVVLYAEVAALLAEQDAEIARLRAERQA